MRQYTWFLISTRLLLVIQIANDHVDDARENGLVSGLQAMMLGAPVGPARHIATNSTLNMSAGSFDSTGDISLSS